MHEKIKVDADLKDMLMRCIVYIMNHMDGVALSHLEPRSQTNATKPWKDSNKIFAYLERVFGSLNRRKNAENKFQALCQGEKNFNTFWAEF